MASVSTRISIRWPPLPASELTNTLVLTGRTKRFVDLRIFNSGPQKGLLNWATAGEKVDLGEGKSLFTNEVDFRSSLHSRLPTDPPLAPDIGHFSPLPNGDDLETGTMANPDAGGEIQPYEEIWRELQLDNEGDEKEECVFLMRELSEGGGKAYLARIGRWELGVFDSSKEFLASRWEKGRSNGEWRMVYPTEEGEKEKVRVALPRIPDGVKEKPGEMIAVGGQKWKVLENS